MHFAIVYDSSSRGITVSTLKILTTHITSNINERYQQKNNSWMLTINSKRKKVTYKTSKQYKI